MLLLGILLLPLWSLALAQTEEEKVRIAIEAAGGVEKLLEQTTIAVANTLPGKLGPNLELRAASYSGRKVLYVAVFLNVPTRGAFDPGQMRVQLGTTTVCASTAGILVRQHGAVIEYEYRASNAEVLYRQVIDRKACT